MIPETEMQALTVSTADTSANAAVRNHKRLRAAEARHRLELLREARLLHDNLADVWDPQYRPVRGHDA